MNCHSCKKEIPTESKFCPFCGTLVVNSDSSEPGSAFLKKAKISGLSRIKRKRVLAILFLFLALLFGAVFTINHFTSTDGNRANLTKTNSLEENKLSGSMSEETASLSPVPTISDSLDSDKDGLTDKEEENYGTNPFLVDTDGDGATDKEEIQTGYDPLKDDCALEVGCDLVAEKVEAKPVNTLLILDASGSMAGMVSGQTKMEAAKVAIREFVNQSPDEINLGFMVYGHQGSNNEKDKAVSCLSSEVLFPIQKLERERFLATLDSFGPVGWTPIAASLEKAQAEAFTGKEGENNSVLLVSDGIETCGGDPCAVAKQLKASGIQTTIDVVGFDVDTRARAQLECIALSTGGQYFHVRTSEELRQALGSGAKKLGDLVAQAQCRLQKATAWSQCIFKKSQAVAKLRLQPDFPSINFPDVD